MIKTKSTKELKQGRITILVLILVIALVGSLGSGCISAKRARYSRSILAKIDRIEIMQGEPTKAWVELGLVEHKFNPLDGWGEIKFTLREQAYSKYGEVDAIIRRSSVIVTEGELLLRLVRGIAIKYIE